MGWVQIQSMKFISMERGEEGEEEEDDAETTCVITTNNTMAKGGDLHMNQKTETKLRLS